jgi:hypothetical protein
VRQRPVGHISEDLLHDRVVPVLSLSLQELYLELSRQPGL